MKQNFMHLLKEIDTRAPKSFDKKEIKEEMAALLQRLNELQHLLYAQSEHAVLVILQGMDASGKDGVITNVFGALNPQGIKVQSFKVPTELEKSHDFLWRIHEHAPAKGDFVIFNRSHYEDVLITRVHGMCDDATALKRFEAINDFEKMLSLHNNTLIFKFYLHISPEEQKERLAERLKDPFKQWKYSKKDYHEAEYWDKYMMMYDDVFTHCSAIPWTIVPADQNWYKQYIVAKTVVDALEELDMHYPTIKEKSKNE